jgi:cell wall-associated NlpC family hydrolase
MRIFEHFGVTTGRTSRDQAANGKEISLDQIQPGDLLFYASGKTINHVALYIGDGKIFVYDVENVVKVRTGEEGYDALQGD